MEGIYEVRFGNQNVGTVTVHRQGLYYRFCCRCTLSGDVLCRLWVRCGEERQDLGIVVPMEGGFGLNTRLPAKRLGQGTPEFTLTPKQQKISGLIVPVYPEEPFAYIGKLKNAYLMKQGDRLGICIKAPGH